MLEIYGIVKVMVAFILTPDSIYEVFILVLSLLGLLFISHIDWEKIY